MKQIVDDVSLLRVDDLHVAYTRKKFFHKYHDFALRGVSFAIKKGEAVAIVGESGCGKTTLARTLIGLEEITRGKITLDEAGPRSNKDKKRISFVFQDPTASLNPRFSVSSILKEPMFQLTDDELVQLLGTEDRIKRKSLEDKYVDKLLDDVHLDRSVANKYPFELSGGQKQRVGIARALVNDPQLLIMDEPVSSLDLSVQAGVLETLDHIKQKSQTSILFITHDLRIANYLTDRVIVMYAGQIMEDGPNEEVFQHPCHPYTKSLFDQIPKGPGETQDDKEAMEKIDEEIPDTETALEIIQKERQDFAEIGCPYRARCEKAQEVCENKPPLAQMTDGRLVACHFPY